MPVERMIVIANSRKTGGRCIAGVSMRSGQFVRPVSPEGNGALSDLESRIDGRTLELLEIVSFEYQGPGSDPAQPENVVIGETPWKLEGNAEAGEALELLVGVADEGPLIFGNRGRAVPAHIAERGMEASLALVEPGNLRFGHGRLADAHAGSPRALFEFGDQEWSLPVTDFKVGPRVLQQPEGLYGWDELGFAGPDLALLTLSLGTVHEGWHHKLVAAVLRIG